MAGAFDLFAGDRSISGSNLFKVDKNPLEQISQSVEQFIGGGDQAAAVPPFAPIMDGIIPLTYFDLEALGRALMPTLAPVITAVGDEPPDTTGLPDGTLWVEI
jgi:hypothetical protein